MSDVVVSVGIPAFRNATTIGNTIQSLRRQTHDQWECFVSCDDGRSETYEAARDAIGDDVRFVLHANEQRLGVPGNWNLVLSRGTADFFKLLCADDLLREDALQRQVNAMLHFPRAALCTGRRDVIDAEGRTVLRSRGLKKAPGPLSRSDVIDLILRLGTNPLGEPSFALYRTEALRQSGGFSASWEYTLDLASYLDVLKLGELVTIDATIGDFRVSSSSWSSSLASQQSRELIRLVDFVVSASDPKTRRTRLAVARVRVRMTAARRRFVFWLLAKREHSSR
ncbi:MAG: glycosyltransferase family A protein [Acidimicrobiales bacterium]